MLSAFNDAEIVRTTIQEMVDEVSEQSQEGAEGHKSVGDRSRGSHCSTEIGPMGKGLACPQEDLVIAGLSVAAEMRPNQLSPLG